LAKTTAIKIWRDREPPGKSHCHGIGLVEAGPLEQDGANTRQPDAVHSKGNLPGSIDWISRSLSANFLELCSARSHSYVIGGIASILSASGYAGCHHRMMTSQPRRSGLGLSVGARRLPPRGFVTPIIAFATASGGFE
jgi:hypothetical protein